MSIALDKSAHVHGFWCVRRPGMSWLAVVLKPEGGSWEGHYRFRYDDEGEKLWFIVTAGDDREKLVGAMTRSAEALCEESEGELSTLVVDCDGETAALELMRQPWMRVVTNGKGGDA